MTKKETEKRRHYHNHIYYIVHHDHPCTSALAKFEFEVLSFLLQMWDDSPTDEIEAMLGDRSKMSEDCIVPFVTERIRQLLAGESPIPPVCNVCKNHEPGWNIYGEWVQGYMNIRRKLGFSEGEYIEVPAPLK